MRRQKTIKLNPDLTVTVMELRPIDIRHAIGLMQQGGDLDFQKLLTEDWDDALAKLSGVIRADKGALEEASFSEIDEIQDAFVEVNAAFFGKLRALGINIKTAPAGPDLSKTLTARVSPLSSVATSDAAATAGDSS